MDSTLVEQLAGIALEMSGLDVKDEKAEVLYDGFAGALYWSDELPDMSARQIRDYWCLRPVFRYRTTLILGAPEEECEEYWKEARRLFPEWIGFHESRREPDDQLRQIYDQLSSETATNRRS